ncbi:MAG: hypothetical protein WAW13_04975 [Minisyncoccia bacterium]
MQGGLFKKLQRTRAAVSLYVIVSILFGSFGNVLVWNDVPKAEAAQVTIDADAGTLGTSHLQSGSQTVFIDDQTGYKFFRDRGGYCVYRKTSNGGTSWSATTTVDAQTDCIGITVWYDRWTPGDTGTNIHIVTMDTSVDDLFYNRLDTNGDTLLMGTGPRDMSTNSGNSLATLAEGVSGNRHAVTKGTDGTIYATVADGTDSYIVECSASCNLATGWTETGPSTTLDLANDYSILAPLPSGDIMLVNRDVSLEDIRYRIWNNTTWSAWTAIDANATDNTTYYVGMALAVSSTTPGNLYLAYIARNAALGTDDQVLGARYNGSAWATTTDILTTTTRGLTNVAIALDAANDDVYVAYTGRTTAATANTGNVYWKTATSSMKNWSTEVGPINTGAADYYGVDLNIASDQRIFASWFNVATADILGDTIADVFPGVHASATGVQTTSTFASTTNVYTGGKFLFYDNYVPASHEITGIVISESGTIDGSTNIGNVELYYETDTTAPYDCASESYAGTESQFGSTDTNGFSGADGVSSFSGTAVTISTTTSLCVYPVMTVFDTAQSSSTIDISIADPSTDVTVTDGIAGPVASQNITGTTIVYNDTPTLSHYHWRNDDGTEATASSKTSGVADTPLTAMRQGSTTRLRMEVSNEGSSSTPAMQYRLEYASNPSTCDVATGWIDVGAGGGDFDMSDTPNLLDGGNSTNIAVATGGVADENITFLTPNAGVKDTSSQTGNITLSTAQFVELEYAIVASTTAAEGNTYCFRVTDQGNELFSYSVLPRANIAADVAVTATSSQSATTSIPSTNFYIGGKYVVTENTGSRNVTSITITENGTVDGQTGLDNIKLYYDMDTTAPYDCGSEAYVGGETQFGSTDTDGFSGPNGTSTFTGSAAISTTSTMCLYTVLDSTASSQNAETIDIIMESPSSNLVVSGGGSVSPSITRDITGSTTLVGAVLTQTHYHWRADTGSEAASPSLTGGVEDTSISNIGQTTPVRLRMQISNEGTVTSASAAFRLEYGVKLSTCSAVGAWTDVGAVNGAWDMFNSTNLTEGSDTTNIVVGTGGVTDENTTFLAPNSAVKDTSSSVATTTLTSSQYIEAEFSIQQTVDSGYDIPYCFRLTNGGTDLNAYTIYPELRSSPERDFEIQRGTVTIAAAATSTLLVAGVDYVAPSASTSAFIRITNTGMTGAGHNTGVTTAQTSANATAYIVDPSNIMTGVRIARTGVTDNTRVSWEIIEFIGAPGSDNEMIVRNQSRVTYGTTALVATGTAVSGIVDDADVVVFITGQQNPLANSTAYNTGLSTSEWTAGSNEPVFRRGSASTNAVIVSYAVVEFTGLNWAIQRSSHTFAAAGTTETEAITAVGSLARTFIHTQKRNNSGLNGVDEFGHEVWLSSIGQVSYFLESGATSPSGQTSVAWIIENLQTNSGAMEVTRSNGSTNAGTPPLTVSVSIGKTLTDITNASIFVNSRSAGATTVYTRPIAGVTIASTTHYQLWRSNTGAALTYRTEIVEWPTAGLAIRQNYYRFYVDNNALTPTDPWPLGGTDLGENTVLTGSDEPLGEGERIRIRMTLQAVNASLPEASKAFRLQYGALTTTCSAISEANWNTLGDSASSTIWRGYSASGTTDGTVLSGDPPTGGDLLLSVSDVSGTFEESNDTGANPYTVAENEDVEYDWIIEQNGANAETYYCFRVVETNGTTLGAYLQYPQLRTASFTPRSQNWRWYDDEMNATPTTTLAAENVAPVDIANQQIVKLRVSVKEIKNISRDDVRFRLQFSENADFSVVGDVAALGLCTGTSTWCYADGGGVDNAIISTSTLSDVDVCVLGVGNGCGTHNESPDALTGFRHEHYAATEYEFTIKSDGPRVNRVYYFRLYDITQNIPVTTNTSESYPSLVTEGASLVFGMAGVASSTTLEGVTTDINTTPTLIPFGHVPIGTFVEGAYRLTVNSNGTEGYQIFMMMTSDLLSSLGSYIKPITSTNAAPASWATGCDVNAASCFGYHTGDDTLQSGSTRFSAIDTYAHMSTTTLEEVSFNSLPVANETTDIVFRLLVRQMQDAGQYESRMMYVSIPVF